MVNPRLNVNKMDTRVEEIENDFLEAIGHLNQKSMT